ncbi:D-alanyl-D-alanine carboxypeptidase [Brevundimonas goettingensis]|uniref:D-alanyl-D-alanine carboxypeptidase n=1 Tax=Brevundimonas goettingensis TaxID=2774190 RepID=A0A975GZY2_9CAUL|nr:D-alanyl-D-alanine carboxypeptidase [Brevundimonas goettingensis]QTC93115.1 D-alanyl-D-alanine carboxypeptidase [Brevundimonas goettingensis]
MTAFFRRIAVGVMAVLAVTAVSVSPLSPISSMVEAQSSDNARYAAIVVDAQTGEVLFARRADDPRYPASVTKMMTLYLTFEALQAGRVKLDDIVTVSPLAASQPPSKLGLAAGQTIRFDDAMRATTVRSCNDMAMVLAEHVGGSQARFAAMATLKARQLGMTQTNYVNPNGLPDSRQVTSARDLAILARAIMRDYPQYYSYFGLHDWAFQGRDYRNTNGLLLGGNGYDGIKTGFTNASGYNLAASAVRNHRRIIVIVMGGRSSATRNAHVAELMNTGFEVENRRAQGETIQVAQTFFEQRGFGVDGRGLSDGAGAIAYASLNGERGSPARDDEDGEGSTAVAYTAAPRQPAPVSSPIHVAGSEVTASNTARSYAAVANAPPPVPTPAPRPENRAVANDPANLTASLNGGVAAPRTTTPARTPPAATRPAAPARPPAGRWAVQVGAFRSESVARDWLTEVNRRFRAQFTDAERAVQSNDGWFRSRFTGMTQAKAEDACEALAARRVTCSVIRPGA